MIINLGCTSVDNHIPRDDIFQLAPSQACYIYILFLKYTELTCLLNLELVCVNNTISLPRPNMPCLKLNIMFEFNTLLGQYNDQLNVYLLSHRNSISKEKY